MTRESKLRTLKGLLSGETHICSLIPYALYRWILMDGYYIGSSNKGEHLKLTEAEYRAFIKEKVLEHDT